MSSPVPYIIAAVIFGLTVVASIVLSVLSFRWDVPWLQHNGNETSCFGFRWSLLVYCIAGAIYEAVFVAGLVVLPPEAFGQAGVFLLALLAIPKCALVYPIFKTSLFPLPAPKKRPGPGTWSNVLVVALQIIVGAFMLVLLGAYGKAGIISLMAPYGANSGELKSDLGPAITDYNRATMAYGAVITVVGLILLCVATYAVRRPKDPELHPRQQGAPRSMLWAASFFTLSGMTWIALAGLALGGLVDLGGYELALGQGAAFVASVILERVLDLAIFIVFVFLFKGDSELKSVARSRPYSYFQPRQGISPYQSPVPSSHHIGDYYAPVPPMANHPKSSVPNFGMRTI